MIGSAAGDTQPVVRFGWAVGLALGALVGFGCANYQARELALNIRACEDSGRTLDDCLDFFGVSREELQAANTIEEKRKAKVSQATLVILGILGGPDAVASSACCKTCTSGKPCGDSCIAASKTCHKPPGCAC